MVLQAGVNHTKSVVTLGICTLGSAQLDCLKTKQGAFGTVGEKKMRRERERYY